MVLRALDEPINTTADAVRHERMFIRDRLCLSVVPRSSVKLFC
jgi:hypothetical protein